MKLILSFLFVLMLGPGLFFMDGAILKDIKLKSETLSPANVPTSDRKCRSKLYLFQSCSFDYTDNQKDLDQSYFFMSFGPPETLVLLRGTKSGVLTSDVGQDYLWNRILTILLFPGLALWALVKYLGKTRQHAAPPLQQTRHVPPHVPTHSGGHPANRATFGKRR
ncbi:MAG: hypothetical protein RIE06_19910 [Roseibium album]|uniref:hypothetical protein n=1 Tax=Roseibium album TaxID=311410 RepID=UPI0024934FF1|nr:hypothetical protein [Roseibium album]